MTVKKRKAEQRDPTTAALKIFEDDGYLVLNDVLSKEQLVSLREECDGLYEKTTADELVELGCVLDIFASGNRSQPARVDIEAYKEVRSAFLEKESSPHILSLIFEDLPEYIRPLFPQRQKRDGLYFFNEHYVVKPPESKVEFRWHQDDTEQLGMCVHRETIPWYLSAWCALDDVTTDNGALQFRHDDGTETPPIVVSAGSVLIFRSDIWHFSAANTTGSIRRAFYVQYSASPITARPQSSDPLCCAIRIDP
ncbi:hypothetical protein LEN26_014944 [Aphanomyces euteiches]|nr:hypothetical protein LEN26_014944 [Aphanomyces euteiches]KAH9128027.1 hypothetical protein AeMF1_001770 [Aphanomyces euteiches]KAH9183507.1 hypothetical protein AeNC1_014516 [Aphanomyces euteiches]